MLLWYLLYALTVNMAYDGFDWNFVFCCTAHEDNGNSRRTLLHSATVWHTVKAKESPSLSLSLGISYSAQTKTINRNWYANRPPLCAVLCLFAQESKSKENQKPHTRTLPYIYPHTHTPARKLKKNVWRGVLHIRILVACPWPSRMSRKRVSSFPLWVCVQFYKWSPTRPRPPLIFPFFPTLLLNSFLI